jgi:Domain of unknown function (DUF4190)
MDENPYQNPSPGPPPMQAATQGPGGIGQDAGMRMLLPVGRSGWAIAAGYLGLVSVLLLPAPIALLISLIAIRDISRSAASPQPKHGMGRAIFGLIMGAIGTVVLILAFLAPMIR